IPEALPPFEVVVVAVAVVVFDPIIDDVGVGVVVARLIFETPPRLPVTGAGVAAVSAIVLVVAVLAATVVSLTASATPAFLLSSLPTTTPFVVVWKSSTGVTKAITSFTRPNLVATTDAICLHAR